MFIYLDPILIYISLWIDCLFENWQNCSMFPLAFVAGWLQGHWWGFISRNYVVWPTFFLMNVFIALKGSHFWFYICLNKELSWTKQCITACSSNPFQLSWTQQCTTACSSNPLQLLWTQQCTTACSSNHFQLSWTQRCTTACSSNPLQLSWTTKCIIAQTLLFSCHGFNNTL